jgi:hypothetical protein
MLFNNMGKGPGYFFKLEWIVEDFRKISNWGGIGVMRDKAKTGGCKSLGNTRWSREREYLRRGKWIGGEIFGSWRGDVRPNHRFPASSVCAKCGNWNSFTFGLIFFFAGNDKVAKHRPVHGAPRLFGEVSNDTWLSYVFYWCQRARCNVIVIFVIYFTWLLW